MQSNRDVVFAREDTMFGVCQALGQDFGFNPVYLRIAFAVPVLFNPLAALGAYLAAAVLVLFSRLLVPSTPYQWRWRRKAAAPAAAEVETVAPAPVTEAPALREPVAIAA